MFLTQVRLVSFQSIMDVFDSERGRMDRAILGIDAATHPDLKNPLLQSKRFEILEDCGIANNCRQISKHRLFKMYCHFSLGSTFELYCMGVGNGTN